LTATWLRDQFERATGARAKHPSVLGGLVFDAIGERLTPTYAIKKGTRYRYYVSSSLVREAKGNRPGRWRIPAGEADPSLLRVLTRAHNIQERLSQDTDLTVHDVAREERVTAAYIYALLRLPWLAPDITTAIVNGRQPHQLSAKTLMRRASRLPADWAEQRALLGF
jgi:hypothetical protein